MPEGKGVPMRNLLLALAYDGSCFHGWQVQKNASSVQETFQDALERVLGQRPDCKGCSRTDAGVHARCFCVSVKVERDIPCARLMAALNHFLPDSMAVLDVREVPEDFHARYSCLGKEYQYTIWNARARNPFLRGRALHYYYSLDLELLNQTAACFLGRHDFTSFCTMDGRDRGDLTRTISCSRWHREGDALVYTVAADGFLYNMVRILVGTQLYAAQGKLSPQDIPAVLAGRDRALAGPTAPPQGLALNRVFYPGFLGAPGGFQEGYHEQ